MSPQKLTGELTARGGKTLHPQCDLRSHPVGDAHAGCIVLGSVDALARRQALQRSLQGIVGCRETALGTQRRAVGIDVERHDPYPLR